MASSFFEKSFKKVLHFTWLLVIIIKSANGGVAKWLNAADCKSVPFGSVVRIHSPPLHRGIV